MNSVCNCLINQSAINWCQNIDFTGARVGIALSIAGILVAMKVNEYMQQPKIVPQNIQAQRIETFRERVYQEELPTSKLDFQEISEYFSGHRNYDTRDRKEAFIAELRDFYNGLPPVERTRIARALVQEARELAEFANSFLYADGQDLAKVFVQNPINVHWPIAEGKALDLHGFLVRNALEYCHREQLMQIADNPHIDSPRETNNDKGKEEAYQKETAVQEPVEPEEPVAKPEEPAQVEEQFVGMVEVPISNPSE